MTISARCSPLAFKIGDVCYFREFPYEFTTQDPGGGSGGSSSIAVELTPGNVALAWMSYGSHPSVASGAFPPSGFPAQPSTAELAAAVKWWPQGFHHYAGVSWSRNFGFIASNVAGLGPDGDVIIGNWCYPYIPERLYTNLLRWTFLAHTSQDRDGRSPYFTNPNAFYRHLGYDLARRKDLVIVEVDGYLQALRVYETSAAIPTVRGAQVWQGTNGDRSLYRAFYTEGGQQCIQIPWLGVWWVNQFSQTPNDESDQIWGFAPTATPAASSSSTPAGFNVARTGALNGMPQAVYDMAQLTGGNLFFAVDTMHRRVFAAQADLSAAPVFDTGINRYPLIIFEVNPVTYSWTPIEAASVLRVANGLTSGSGSKVNLAPFVSVGGAKFLYLDQYGGASATFGNPLNVPGNPMPSQLKSTGGFFVREIYIPKASARSMTWTQRTWTGNAVGGNAWNSQKHVELTFCSADGKIYAFGGDHGMGSLSDPTLTQGGSYNNQVLRFSPESGADLELLEQACPASGATDHPIMVDECGWQYRPSSADFWMMCGYSAGNWTNTCGWASRAVWEASGGGVDGFFRWSPVNGWSHDGRTHGETITMQPKTGFTNRTWIQGESHCKRWYYDSGADVMIGAAYGAGGTNPDVGLQGPAVQIMDCVPSEGGVYQFAKYKAHVCSNGLGGNKNLLPDGRPTTDPVLTMTTMWAGDRCAVDPATGHLYVFQPATGDIFRIYTRSDFWTDVDGIQGARVDWVCKAMPTESLSGNHTHMIWAKGALWILNQSQQGRLRAYSWAPGDSNVTEHVIPILGAIGTAVCKYTVGGDERLCVIGNQAWSPDGGSWSPLLQADFNKYYTVTLT